MIEALDRVKRLVEQFQNHIDAYKSGGYKEAEVRAEFVDPLFKALGWDVHNEQGYAEAYKDVILEYSLKGGGRKTEGANREGGSRESDLRKAPDYCFRIGGASRFFLEAKKPSVDIRDAVAPAFQIRRYAWSAQLPVSILTDFEEFAVYDCSIRPKEGDKASVARILYYTYKDYIEKWEEIYGIFSKEAILKGSFDRFVISDKKKRGTATVDQAFLVEMEDWRDGLARNIALRNRALSLSPKELNLMVQATIDRIVFLRICEDRNIEPYGQLQNIQKRANIYPSLCELFQRADDKYNSGMFHFKEERGLGEADRLSLKLSIDDKVLSDLIQKLYYPAPYVFSEIPAEILGQIYEQFLGKVIRLTPDHRAKIELKPEVRKAGGVYYTPKYIVDYIVGNTVGQLLKGKSPAQAKKLRILDPACGSGSFLLGAYQYLLNWYLAEYAKYPERHKKLGLIYDAGKDDWRLSTQEKKAILLSNIYGVDIDRQAVEVTKLSLLLKVLEGESKDTLESQLRLFKQRALPDLGGNIKCGNSLIGIDFLIGKKLELFGKEEVEKINPFDWEDEERGFGKIMQAGRFDAVIGNPPWGAELGLYVEYLKQNYKCKTKDSAAYFVEAFIKQSSLSIGLIVPKTISYYSAWGSIREIIQDRCTIQKILDCGICFPEVNLEALTLILKKSQANKKMLKVDAAVPVKRYQDVKKIMESGKYPDKLTKISKIIPTIGLRQSEIALIEKLYSSSLKVGDLSCEIFRGLYIPDSEKENLRKGIFKFINKVPDVKYYCIDKVWEISLEKNKKYLEKANKILRPRIFFKVLRGKKIICYPDIKGELLTTEKLVNFILDQEKHFFHYYYICGLFNSKLLSFYIQKILFSDTTETSRVLDAVYLNHFILPDLNLSNSSQKTRHDRMVSLVDQMLATQKKLQAASSEIERRPYQQMADALDRQIDDLVYELYGLTAEEIRIVEGKANA